MMLAPSARAAPDSPVCTAPGALPPELAAWAVPGTRVASGKLTLGVAAQVTLLPTPAVTFALPPQKPGTPDSFGATLPFDVAQRGIYRVVLGARAWIDLVGPDGTAVASVAHSMGPVCTGIRKMVDFALEPGRYRVQLSGNDRPEITVMVIRQR